MTTPVQVDYAGDGERQREAFEAQLALAERSGKPAVVHAREADADTAAILRHLDLVIATDTAMRVTTDAVQLFGGYGYCKDYPIEKHMRDAKITQIYEGTNQVQRIVMAKQLLR